MKTASETLIEAAFQIEQSTLLQARKCEKRAPYIFFVDGQNVAHLVQGCCNNWQCARCGQIRARQEYRRIVDGAVKLAESKDDLFFLTMTCKGRNMPLEEAEKNYMKWTNRALSTLRANARKRNVTWEYVQVTERQKRKHPHSHIIATWYPEDGIPYLKGEKLPNGRKAKHNTIWSEYYRKVNVSAGLGIECDLSRVETPEAASSYIAKYLFQDSFSTVWPKGWRRIRYSQGWPKLPEREMKEAFPIIKREDWRKIAFRDEIIYADSYDTVEECYKRLITNVVYAREE